MNLKVCGLTKQDQIQHLLDIDVPFLGFIFYKSSPRFVLNHLSLAQLLEINSQGKVGVFVNETISRIIEISNKTKLNYIQLHGDETNVYIKNLRKKLNQDVRIIKAIRIANQSSEELQTIINNQSKEVDFLLFDKDSSAFGGTGKSFDWQLLNKVEIAKPFFLSGGVSKESLILTNEIRQKPFALDINSKFEIEPGNKDINKIKDFKIQIINSKQ